MIGRALRDRVARVVITIAGFLSLALLLAIFILLVRGALLAMVGGIDAQPITGEERAALAAQDVAALEHHAVARPSVAALLVDPVWAPTAEQPRWGLRGMIVSTLLTTAIALVVAVPLGFAAAAGIAFVLRGRTRELIKLGVELLAAIPSVVVGFVGLALVGPWLARWTGAAGGLHALHGGLLLGLMALPTIISIAEDALRSVPRSIVEGALALGADRVQTLVRVVMPAAGSGLLAAAMLGAGRAIGETMTVLMATGNAIAMPSSPLDPVRTLTATIAIELGEVPVDSTHYHALFGVGLALFSISMLVNLVAGLLAAPASGSSPHVRRVRAAQRSPS